MQRQQKTYYAGFWSRALAFVTDIFMIGLPISFVIMAIFGYDQMHSASALELLQGQKPVTPPNPMIAITQMGLYSVVTILLWKLHRGQTPGKKLAKIRVVDRKSLGDASWFQLTVRFFAYFLSFITLVGFFLPLLFTKKEALHDLISNTVVIYDLD